ncbi:hypothetical protein [Fulvimarina endophytica]|uniref:hypothetical protein n=1 Tax=Fulvimarina endophytica TaxID=2293836 RepID=UPI0013144244|nr:hypothetical protein [Fulvimarina endophytica]
MDDPTTLISAALIVILTGLVLALVLRHGGGRQAPIDWGRFGETDGTREDGLEP